MRLVHHQVSNCQGLETQDEDSEGKKKTKNLKPVIKTKIRTVTLKTNMVKVLSRDCLSLDNVSRIPSLLSGQPCKHILCDFKGSTMVE